MGRPGWAARACRPDVITSTSMPADGWRLTALADPATAEIPVVMLSVVDEEPGVRVKLTSDGPSTGTACTGLEVRAGGRRGARAWSKMSLTRALRRAAESEG
jgi:hypothetical protein